MKRLSLVALLIAGTWACSKPKPPEPTNMETPPKTTAGTSTPAEPAETNTPSIDNELGTFTVYFDFDSWTVRADSRDTLSKVAEALKSNKDVKIQIEGHCDERGSNEYNLALGERRARAVEEFLVSEGVSEDRLSTISYGEERPAALGTGEAVWAKNRRAEFKRM